MRPYFNHTTGAGVAGGTVLTILDNISSQDLIRTALLATVGALVSFVVTLGLKFIFRRIKK